MTGGASGLGGATVASVVAAGARAVVLDLPSAGDHLEPGEQIRFVGGDVRDEDDVVRAVAAAGDFGILRAAVNCAGVATPGRVVGKRGVLPLEDFRRVIKLNLIGTFNCSGWRRPP